jgi:polysaccharide biosynthesis/export protein
MVRPSFRGRAVYWLASAISCVALAATMLPAFAQTPSAEQIEIFQGLPPDQQQAILEAMGQGGGSATRSSRPRADRELKFPETVRQRSPRDDQDDALDSDGLAGPPREARLKGNDTVLLTLEIRQLERLAPEIEERERRAREDARRQGTLPNQPLIPGRQPNTPSADAAGQSPQQRPLARAGEDLVRLEDFRERVLRRNPYKLDKWGILNLPELGPIPLGGLTAEEATERLAAE